MEPSLPLYLADDCQTFGTNASVVFFCDQPGRDIGCRELYMTRMNRFLNGLGLNVIAPNA